MKKLFIPFFTLFVLISLQTQAQSFQIGAGLGYSLPSGDYGGETTEFYSGKKYGMESGFNIHAKARLGLPFINLFGEVGYSSFSGEGNAEASRGTLKVSNNVISIKAGPEYSFSIPLSPLTPYLQGFVAFNSFSGKVDIKGVSNVPSGEYDIKSTSRIGLGLGAGVMFKLASINLDFNLQYHMMNISGKEFTSIVSTSHDRLENYISLNDDKDPLYNANSDRIIGDSRSIGAIELKISVLFGL